MRFFHPMDARWCCPSTVFSFSSTPLFLLFFNHVVFLLSASRSINCAASSERTIAIIVCMFCGPIVLAHGCYMTREFRREGKLIVQAEPNAASEAYKLISKDIWGVDVMPFQSRWMLYGLESEAKAILKFENETLHKVRSTGLWVNPKFPFLACSPDGLVGDNTVIEIKSLKIFEQNTIEAVTCSNTLVPKDVLRRQCFEVKDGKCVLKRNHSYYYQCQHILLVTERKFCKFILYAKNGPDSVENIARDEPLIENILKFLTAFWVRVIAPEIFEMRVLRELLPFILPEIDLDAFDVPDTMNIEISSIPSPVDSGKGSDLEETDPVRADNFYTHKEIEAAEALLFAVTDANKPSAPTHPSDQDSDLTLFPWGGVTSTGITMTNTCPLDNWLMIFQALVKSGKVTLTDLTESGHIIANALQLIDSGLYADAKLVILQALTQRPQIVFRTLDLYGNESDFFLTLLSPYLANSTVTTCSSNFCPAPVNTVKSTSIILPLPTGNHSGENVFSHSLTAWLFPGDSQCGRKFKVR